ncbi:MAG: hypothetical protein N4A71_02385 [Carboxylicivirga sp.]|jgi:hypothetical protein|nr:hypothetical protein [Carboxylicivirga sp.]
MSANLFTVTIPVKPYIKQYLINNLGHPVDIARSDQFASTFFNLLSKENCIHQKTAGKVLVIIKVSKDVFHRYGFNLTNARLKEFHSELERCIKFEMRNFIGLKTILGYSVAEAIRQFQEKKNYPEDIWSYEAIKKDIDRNTTIKRCNDVDDFLELMDREIKQRISDSMEELNKTECREVETK